MTASTITRHSFTLAGTSFSSKQALAQFLSNLLRDTPTGDVITGEAADVVLALIERHPHREQKIGIGIRAITTGRHPTFKSPCFRIVRRDGTETDFSYQKCLRGLGGKDSQSGSVESVLRITVRDQINAWKSGQPDPFLCAISGKYVWKKDGQVDHKHPNTFKTLMESFLDREGLTSETFPIADTEDDRYGAHCPDRELVARWQAFHAEHSDLRLIEAGTNSRLSNRPPIENPVVQKRIADLIAATRNVSGEFNERRKEAKRAHLLRLGAEVANGRGDLKRWLTDADIWLTNNPQHPEWEERQEAWLTSLNEYIGMDNAIADSAEAIA